MAAVSVYIPSNRTVRSPSMQIYTSKGHRSPMFSAPRGFSSKHVARYATVQREGLSPINRVVGSGLRTVQFTHIVASMDIQKSCQSQLTVFENIGASGERVRFTGGSAIEGAVWWVVKDLAINVVQRALNNEPSRASLQWTLEEYQDVTYNLIRPPAPKRATSVTVSRSGGVTRTYRVVSGDSLWVIASKTLHNGARWGEIFSLNRATMGGNPNRLRVGQVLKIPAR